MSDIKKKRWFNNGQLEKCCFECPQGWFPGRLPKIGQAASKRMQENNPMYKLTEEQKKARAEKLHLYNLNKTEEQRKHKSAAISKANKGKLLGNIPWNKGKKGAQEAWNKGKQSASETKEKISNTKRNKSDEEKMIIANKISDQMKGKTPWNKGKTTGPWTEEDKKIILEKQHQTKKKNNSFNISNPENIFKEYLINKYGEENIISQYRDEDRYPFNCDFYIKSKDLFIELNLTWTHGNHPFNEDNEEDNLLLEYWKQKAETSDYYKNAIYTWTILDVKKQKIAKENKLNYLCIYDLEDYYNND